MINFNLNFGGFYCSEYEQLIDSMLETYFSDDDGDCVELPDNIKYNVIFEEYSKQYLPILNTVLIDEYNLDVLFHFKEINRPREYNFSTDSILTSISDKSFNKLKNHFMSDIDCIKFINRTSASRDGFISFYNGINAVSEDNEILLEYIFNYIIDTNRDQLFNELRDNTSVYEILYNLDFQELTPE